MSMTPKPEEIPRSVGSTGWSVKDIVCTLFRGRAYKGTFTLVRPSGRGRYADFGWSAVYMGEGRYKIGGDGAFDERGEHVSNKEAYPFALNPQVNEGCRFILGAWINENKEKLAALFAAQPSLPGGTSADEDEEADEESIPEYKPEGQGGKIHEEKERETDMKKDKSGGQDQSLANAIVDSVIAVSGLDAGEFRDPKNKKGDFRMPRKIVSYLIRKRFGLSAETAMKALGLKSNPSIYTGTAAVERTMERENGDGEVTRIVTIVDKEVRKEFSGLLSQVADNRNSADRPQSARSGNNGSGPSKITKRPGSRVSVVPILDVGSAGSEMRQMLVYVVQKLGFTITEGIASSLGMTVDESYAAIGRVSVQLGDKEVGVLLALKEVRGQIPPVLV